MGSVYLNKLTQQQREQLIAKLLVGGSGVKSKHLTNATKEASSITFSKKWRYGDKEKRLLRR